MALRIHNHDDEDDHDDEELRQSDSCEHGSPHLNGQYSLNAKDTYTLFMLLRALLRARRPYR